jgi:DNA repair protein RadC
MLKTVEGVGESAILNIKIIGEIINRVLKDKAKSKPILDNWQAVQNYASAALASLNYEVFRVLFLNKNFQIIEDELLAIGENDFVQISVKSIVKKALLLHSTAIILMHNHPTSTLKASASDIKTTNEICAVLKPLNIKVIDHLIVGTSGIFSFKEEGLL